MKSTIDVAWRLARCDRPTGYLLSFFPALWGLLMAVNNIHDLLYYSVLFFIGSIATRGAGCIINDLLDQEYDAQVKRTATRPLASNEISRSYAILALSIFLIISSAILLSLTVTSIIIGCIAFCMILIYPLMKRITYLPQVFLGFTFNLGSLIAYSAITDNITIEAAILYLGCCAWTISYDTIYAFMDIIDDKKIGVKSMAILLENIGYKYWIIGFYFVFLIVILMINYPLNSYWSIMLMLMILSLLLWQAMTLNIGNPDNCLRRFKNNNYVGVLISCVMLIEYFSSNMIHYT